ncbi:GGDEF domain-containing protein [Holophaga foetida]|uniref:GGDEF domain-containing protein n=1 Tax=Holophaga foetida TaxID=35839 RepID=UPI00024749DE|nr:GGDEF domain-containing protein [Holophaga foetida]
MEFFGWDSRFATGIASVDDQHHWLVDQMNAFTEMISRSDEIPRAELERVFSLLMDYAIRHFSDEESLMEEAGIDPRHLEKHKHEHQAYIQALAQDQKAILDTPTTAHHLLTFLGNWLVYHITGRDQGMAKQIAAIHAGTPPSEAYALEVHSREGAADPLLKALNAMVDQIMDRNSELMQWNRTLEARVDERTQALQEAMGKLAAEMAESRRLTTELADANEQLRQAALTDVLTGLPNRRHARERLRQFWSESLRHGTPFSCIMIDADGFKQVNDTYGHEAGDAVLRELARTLSSNTRSEDVVCRLGGDEFLVLCPQTNLEGAKALAENLRAKVSATRVPAGDGEWRGSLSLGVAERREAFKKPDELVVSADKGLYAAKRGGRNQVGVAEE